MSDIKELVRDGRLPFMIVTGNPDTLSKYAGPLTEAASQATGRSVTTKDAEGNIVAFSDGHRTNRKSYGCFQGEVTRRRFDQIDWTIDKKPIQ